MPRIRDILPGILAVRSSAIDQALSHALAYADPDEVGELASAMLQRGKANGVEALIAEFHRLPAETRSLVISRADDYATSIRRAATSKGPAAAKNALKIIEKASSTRMAYLVASLCRNADPEVREKAGRCMVTLAKRAASSADPQQQPNMDAASTRFLLDTLNKAIEVYSRNDQAATLEAMLWLMPRRSGDAQALLNQPDHPATAALDQLIQEPGNNAVQRALLRLIGCAPLTEACRDALVHTNASGQLGETLSLGHLLAMPKTRKQIQSIKKPDVLWPDSIQQTKMPAYAQRWLPTYITSTSARPIEQVDRLSDLIKLPAATTRLATLRQLITIARQGTAIDSTAISAANDAIAAITQDAEPAIARTALWHLIHADYAGLPRILPNLINSQHETIRQVAAKRLAPLGFTRFWEAWPKLSKPRRLTAGRALIKIDNEFHRHIAAKLASTDSETRLRALVVIATLNQGFFFEDALLELCTSDDPHTVASAIRALSGCTSEAAKQTLRLAIEHDDTRIRSNALEAMSQSQTAANLDRLLEVAGEDEQRPRANAIKALLELKARDALPSLTRMLGDHRSAHRISALWLIDELGILQLAKQVAEMSLSDDDIDVKAKAGHVIQHLIHDLEQHNRGPQTMTEAV